MKTQPVSTARRAAAAPQKETILEQIASFVGFFLYLLVIKSFFLPLFIIPTGSMAETLYGAYAGHTCPNCGFEYPVGFRRQPDKPVDPKEDPYYVQCPNCRWAEAYRAPGGSDLQRVLYPTAGDRIVVHGWPYVFGGSLGPRRWDVVVFKNPNEPQVNYIKRLIGLPGEKIEIIDGDIYVDDQIARKTPGAQQSLWFTSYDHDYAPQRANGDGYRPRWVPGTTENGWQDLDTRTPTFAGLDRPVGEIRFVTRNGGPSDFGDIKDVYGYNSAPGSKVVADIRLSCQVRIDAGDGYVELAISKYDDVFFARFYADGRVTLEHGSDAVEGRELWGQGRVAPHESVRLALGNVDYRVTVEVNDQAVIEYGDQYRTSPRHALEMAERQDPARQPHVFVRATRVNATLAHLLIQRDVFYTSEVRIQRSLRLGNGVAGNPIHLRDADYFVLGDNSPESSDSRYWSDIDPYTGAPLPGPHLQAAFKRGEYQLGTVPADQMIGRAFFVYWPGFMPLFPGGPNLLPNAAHVRWID